MSWKLRIIIFCIAIEPSAFDSILGKMKIKKQNLNKNKGKIIKNVKNEN